MKIIIGTLMLAGVACCQSTTVYESTQFGGWPLGIARVTKLSCTVDYTTTAYGALAQCLGISVCSPGSALHRTTLLAAAGVQEFCTGYTMKLQATGGLLGRTGLYATSYLQFPGLWWAKANQVFHDSNDDCNQPGPYNNNAQSRPCPRRTPLTE